MAVAVAARRAARLPSEVPRSRALLNGDAIVTSLAKQQRVARAERKGQGTVSCTPEPWNVWERVGSADHIERRRVLVCVGSTRGRRHVLGWACVCRDEVHVVRSTPTPPVICGQRLGWGRREREGAQCCPVSSNSCVDVREWVCRVRVCISSVEKPHVNYGEATKHRIPSLCSSGTSFVT